MWVIAYGPQGFDIDTANGILLDTNYYNITGLSDTIAYDFYVVAACDISTGNISDIVGPLNFNYEPPLSCPEPTDLAASNITNTAAVLTWLAGGEETTWELVYGPEGFDIDAGSGTLVPMLDTNYYELTGLTDTTSYDFYVKADCGFGIDTITYLSIWAGPFTFSTYGFYYQVTFQVDMSQEDSLTGTPYLRGSWDWSHQVI
jgi:hypothetical protein